MPTIIVISNESAEHGSAVLLSENVQPEHFASDHHAVQLIERLGWAVNDAKEAETEDAGQPGQTDDPWRRPDELKFDAPPKSGRPFTPRSH